MHTLSHGGKGSTLNKVCFNITHLLKVFLYQYYFINENFLLAL